MLVRGRSHAFKLNSQLETPGKVPRFFSCASYRYFLRLQSPVNFGQKKRAADHDNDQRPSGIPKNDLYTSPLL